MIHLSFYLLFNIAITSLASLLFIYFIVMVLLVKEKESPHWILLAICCLSLFRITSFYLLIIPVLKENTSAGILFYRILTITFFFLPALLAHIFYSLLYKNDKIKLLIILFLYGVSFIFYVAAIIGVYPTANEIQIINDKIFFINTTSSYIYKSVIIYFSFSYFFTIYIIHSFSKIKMTKKDKKIITIIKWVYIVAFGYGYIIQFFISLVNPAFYSLAPYLLIILSVVIYFITKNYNFLKIYNTRQFLSILNENFSVMFIVTDENGIIIKSNLTNMDNKSIYGESIFSVFKDFEMEINSTFEEGKAIKNLNYKFHNHYNNNETEYTVDINPIRDIYKDIIGLFLVLSTNRLSSISFSKRELEIINYLEEGKLYKEIAYELNISYNTVNSHVKKIYKKANVTNRAELLDILNNNK